MVERISVITADRRTHADQARQRRGERGSSVGWRAHDDGFGRIPALVKKLGIGQGMAWPGMAAARVDGAGVDPAGQLRGTVTPEEFIAGLQKADPGRWWRPARHGALALAQIKGQAKGRSGGQQGPVAVAKRTRHGATHLLCSEAGHQIGSVCREDEVSQRAGGEHVGQDLGIDMQRVEPGD
eukprot:Skav219855  [mRNA]  locus=scaffold859:730314:734829:- [translate_table: standard]